MTIESLGRKNGPKPGEHGLAANRHSRRPQPETRAVPTARPKPAPPRPIPGDEARRGGPNGPQGPQGPKAEVDGTRTGQAQDSRDRTPAPGQSQGPNQGQGQGQGPGQGPMQKRGRGDGKAEGQNRGGDRSLYDGGSPSANRLGPAKAMRARDVSRPSNW